MAKILKNPHSDDTTGLTPVTDRSKVISEEVYQAGGEAQKIIVEAQAEAKLIRQSAEAILSGVEEERKRILDQAYQTGHEQGLASVTEALLKVKEERAALLQTLEKDLVALACDIAEKVIGRELAEREGAIADLIHQALQGAIGQKVVVVVNPHDLENVRNNQVILMQGLDAARHLQIRADEKVKVGGCLIESEIGTIDAELATQLGAIRGVLGLAMESKAV